MSLQTKVLAKNMWTPKPQNTITYFMLNIIGWARCDCKNCTITQISNAVIMYHTLSHIATAITRNCLYGIYSLSKCIKTVMR